MGEVIVRCMDLPCAVKGCVIEDAAGDFNIYINTQYSCEIQEQTLQHEMKHIKDDDFHSQSSVGTIELLT